MKWAARVRAARRKRAMELLFPSIDRSEDDELLAIAVSINKSVLYAPDHTVGTRGQVINNLSSSATEQISLMIRELIPIDLSKRPRLKPVDYLDTSVTMEQAIKGIESGGEPQTP